MAPVLKGQRLIIVHAGGRTGFIPGPLLIFKSHLKTGDYHSEMNATNYQKWLTEKLIPNLPPKSALVDNAPYHNVQFNKAPTSQTMKAKMMEWLTVNNLPFHDGMLKIQLYNLIKAHKPLHKISVMDNIMAAYGHGMYFEWLLKFQNRVKLLLSKVSIAQKRKSHTAGENLIMPAGKITVGMLGQDIATTHCFIHREMLVRLFNRVFELKGELQDYFQENSKPDYANYFEDEEWLEKLACLADTFHHMNQLSKRLQGPRGNFVTSSHKILGFKRKHFWKNHSLIENHHDKLRNIIKHYLPSISTQVCELQSECTLKIRFTDLSLDKFWISMKEEYPAIHRKAINILLQFLISYMCKQAYSCLTSIKSKDINCLISVEDKLWVSLSKVRPRITYLCSKNKHMFHIKIVNFMLYFNSKYNNVLKMIFLFILL
ncbi:hypothetical protein B7P43_G06869 [Cryptotermes secundus]|uniref:Uncharacterized protein n=1 Tax=Cryptotermes secundus TaxID=105785 RepID=A0A2J7R317_9NEOP|nr:hypothetical protein B7P43_G06869 [Cryptotermes secundus]